MNQVNLIGRLTRDPEIRYSHGAADLLCVAAFTLAVDRPNHKEGQQSADFITCKAFGKTAELLEKYQKKGNKIGVTGRIQTSSYQNREGKKVYATDVIVDRVYFLNESQQYKAAGGQKLTTGYPEPQEFTSISDESEELPFN